MMTRQRRPVLSSTVVLLVVSVLSLSVTTTRADFEPNQVAGLYFLERGPPSCEEDILMGQTGNTVHGEQIRGRNFECRGGSIVVEPGTKKNGNEITRWLANGLASIGVFLIGKVTDDIRCGQRGGGQSSFKVGEVWNFVDTRANVKLDFKRIGLRKNAPLRKQPEMVLYDEVEYLFVSDRCVYRQSWYVCFPASSRVQTRRGHIRMDELQVGDDALVANHRWSRVFMWTHRRPTTRTFTFVRLETDAGRNVTLTAGHHLRASGTLMPAGKVRVGDTLEMGDGGVATVTRVGNVQERGFFNPQTLHGDIVVDGVVTSTYTKAVRPRKAHAALAPLRAVYRMYEAMSGAWR